MRLKYIVVIIILTITQISCDKDFETINVNPSQPTSTFMEALFNGVIESLQLTWDGQFYVDNEVLYPITQLGALTGNEWPSTALGIDAIWNNYYETLKNIRELENRYEAYPGDQEELVNVIAMTKIIKAYKTFIITDLFGDIPYSQAGKGNQDLDLLKPKYDSQASIYKSLLKDLQWANENINENPAALATNGEPLYTFGAYDALLGSNMTSWKKFANSLALRHAMRMIEVDRSFAEPIIENILTNNLPVLTKGEAITLNPRQLGFTKLSTHWSFREHKNLRMGETIWKALNGDNPSNLDPRAALFFDTNNNSQWVPYPNAIPQGSPRPTEGGLPYGSQRDNSYAIKGVDNLYSSFQYYLIRDENDIPEILMTSSEVGFIKAEAILRGIGVPKDDFGADTEYSQGIIESIQFWQSVANNCEIWNEKPTITNAQLFNYPFSNEISLSANDFDVSYIYAQRWLSLIRQPWEAFALMRRTQMTPYKGERPNYNKLKYPVSEANFNSENYQAQLTVIGGNNSNEAKVWWMP